ncbi:MAG: hypothetical protein KA278_02280 [Flavobacterium sp.]|jgi:hypothetical protein|nr:hypothetical protein [Flavobacterium sp.]
MKKLIVLAGLVIGMASCKKENCNCGVVQSDNVSDYSVVIKNSCSENNKTFYLSESDWMKAYVGSDYCINDVDSW